jgi:hypothetical protein
MALLSDVRAGLATTLASISGLRTSALMSSDINPPQAVVIPATGEFMTYGEVFEPGVSDYHLEVVLLCSYADERTAQQQLDGYLSATGPGSVRGVIAADQTLGGVVDYAVAEVATGYGLIEWSGIQYLGARVSVTAGTQ